MENKFLDHIVDVLAGSGCIATIWGLTLADIDLINKIIWTAAVGAVTIYSILRKKKQ
jgi:hypothetical protein